MIVPPIKCQGIKSKLVPSISKLIPKYKIWYEPFMGSGVVGFNIQPKIAVFSDTNPHLINFYNDIKNNKINNKIARDFLEYESEKLLQYGEEHYLENRKKFNETPNSLLFLFLNRSCFNGLMRFNSKGGFNVPFCKKNNRFSKSYITKIVNQISNVQNIIAENDYIFECCDFKSIIRKATYDDFIYCDPPYIDRHSDYFNKWTEAEEKELFFELKQTKSKFILSTWNFNNYRKNIYIDKFWRNFNIVNIPHFYFLGGKEVNRNIMTESLVVNL